jgi:methyl-accepting chemotaxis protein
MTALTEEALITALQNLHANINKDIREISQTVEQVNTRLETLEEVSEQTRHVRHVSLPAALGPGVARSHVASQDTPVVEDGQAAFCAVQDAVSRTPQYSQLENL